MSVPNGGCVTQSSLRVKSTFPNAVWQVRECWLVACVSGVGGARLRGDHFHATITLHAAAILSRGFVGDAAEAAIKV